MSVNKTNTNIPFIHHEIIEEWDIRSANTSLMKYYKLANPKLISKFEKMDKRDREVSVGMLIKKNREFANALEKMLNNKDLRKQMGLKGCLRYKERYTLEVFEKNFCGILSDILK